ncbi:RNA polymerase sigma factor RpoD/SigA, partial [candidate division CSSED10-310 bacterium]
VIRSLHFTQDFINSYVDGLRSKKDFFEFYSALPPLPHSFINEVYEKLQEARTRHHLAVCHLVRSNLRLVIKIAKKYCNTGIPFSDILQEGNLGLIKAVDRFDHRRGNRFSTYATWWIKQSITRSIVHRGRIIRLPIHLSEKIKRLQRNIDNLNQALGREPTWGEISDILNQSEEKLLTMITLQQKPLSLDPMSDDSDDLLRLQQVIADDSSIDPLLEITSERLKQEVTNMLQTLSCREQKVIQLRFGIDAERKHTLEEVGNKLGVTRERIRQIESRALDKLKHPSRSKRLVNYL